MGKFISGTINRVTNGNDPLYFDLLSISIRLEKCEHDTELSEVCSVLFALISQALTLPSTMEKCLKKIDELSYHPSWSARLSIVDILQVLVFNNMTIVCMKWVQYVESIVLRLLEDSILEVREKSGQVLAGLIHSSFLSDTDKLFKLFKTKCRTKIKRVQSNSNESYDSNALITRHCGILGLCSFINAYPYDIPDFIPDVLDVISNHLNDPQPIPATIRKTLASFKRTHHDGWNFHKLKFTESQLDLLNDLLIPPSYFN